MTPRRGSVCSGVILLNAIFIGICTNTKADLAFNGGVLADEWNYIEWTFCIFFLFELVIRLVAEKYWFFFGADWKWNLFDTILVSQSMFDELSTAAGTGFNFTFARVLRIFRFARILRIVRVMRFFSSFRLMVYSILGSMLNLLWVFLLLFFVLYFFSIFFLNGVAEYITDAEEIKDAEVVENLELMYGNLPEALLSLFMCISSGDDWGNRMAPIRSCGFIYFAFFIFYVFFMIFGVLNVVVGMFVEVASAVSQRDREVIIENELSRVQEYSKNIKEFFGQADKDHSGSLSWEELEAHLKHDSVSWMSRRPIRCLSSWM